MIRYVNIEIKVTVIALLFVSDLLIWKKFLKGI